MEEKTIMKGLQIPDSGEEITNLDQRIQHQATEHLAQLDISYYQNLNGEKPERSGDRITIRVLWSFG